MGQSPVRMYGAKLYGAKLDAREGDMLKGAGPLKAARIQTIRHRYNVIDITLLILAKGTNMALLRWVAALVLGGFLILFGVTKFTGGAHIFPYIEYKATALEVPLADLFFPYVNYAVGLLELGAGALILLPATRQIGSLIALVPFLGAVLFHLSPLLGVVTPDGYASPAPAAALQAGGPFLAEHFSAGASPSLFIIAFVMLAIAIGNALVLRWR